MRDALKAIARYRNPAAVQNGTQQAAKLAQETLDGLGLFLEADVHGAATDDKQPSGA